MNLSSGPSEAVIDPTASAPDSSASSETRPENARLPGWFNILLSVVLALAIGYSIAAIVLGAVGLFRWFIVGPAALVLTWAVFRLLARAAPQRVRVSRSATISAALILVVAALAAGVNLKYSSQHLAADRDPGVYVITARWLATHGRLTIPTNSGAFEGAPSVSPPRGGPFYHVPAWYENRASRGKAVAEGWLTGLDNDTLYPQFMHLLPAWLAGAAWVGGSWLLVKFNALIGALALLFVYAFATRILRPWSAFGATSVLAVSIITVSFSRDAFTEPLALGLVFAGLWALWGARSTLSWQQSLVAGLAFGTTIMARIDFVLLVAPIVVYLAFELCVARTQSREDARRRLRYVSALAAGVAIATVVGLIDGILFARPYLIDLRHSLIPIVAGTVGIVVIAVPFVVFARPLSRSARRYERLVPLVGALIGIIVVVAAVALFVIGPDKARFVGRWLSWYYPVVVLVFGIAGLGILWYRLFDRRHSATLLVFLGAGTLFLLGYEYDANISPDQVWAMRRFLPVAIPTVLISAFFVLDLLWSRWATGVAAWAARGVVGVVAAIAVLFPMIQTARVVQARSHVPMLDYVDQVCGAIGPDAAVVVIGDDLFADTMPVTFQAFCGPDVARAKEGFAAEDALDLAATAAAQGRTLYLIGSETPAYVADTPALEEVLVIDGELEFLERVDPPIERAPNEIVTVPYPVRVIEVSP